MHESSWRVQFLSRKLSHGADDVLEDAMIATKSLLDDFVVEMDWSRKSQLIRFDYSTRLESCDSFGHRRRGL